MSVQVATPAFTAVDIAEAYSPQPNRPLTCVEADALGQWAGAWDDLVLHGPLASPFLRSWWLEGTGERPHFVLFLDGEELVGGLALDRRRMLGVDMYRVLSGGKLAPDHLDLVAAPDRVSDVVEAARTWFDSPGSRVVDLDGVREHAWLLGAFTPAVVTADERTIWAPLGTTKEYYAARSKTFTKRIRQRRRRSEGKGIRFRRAGDAEVGAVLADFAALHARRPDRRELLVHMRRIERAVRRGVRRGEVRLHVAEKDGRSCGALISFTSARRLRIYQIARLLDEEFSDVGTILFANAIEEACEDGFTEVDFLRGDEEYKYSFAGHERQLLRIRSAHGAGGRALLRGLLVATAVRRYIKGLRNRGPRPEGRQGGEQS